jgi:hypothetical protein
MTALRLRNVAFAAAFMLAVGGGASAQTELGGAAGAVFGWPQDVTVETRDERGHTTAVLHEDSLPVQRGGIFQLGFSRWSDARPSTGIGLELVGWRNSLQIATSSTAPRRGFREERAAFLVYLSGRMPLSASFRTYLYGGLGGGLVASRVRRSRAAVGPALSLLGGVSLPLGSRGWRTCLEGRYLLTRDFDALVHDHGSVSNLEFSGHPSVAAARPILGPHMDSRFGAILLALRWTAPHRGRLRPSER